MRLLGTFILVQYVYFVSDLYCIVADTIVGHGYKLRFTFSHGSYNQVSFIHVHNYCTFVASVLLLR